MESERDRQTDRDRFLFSCFIMSSMKAHYNYADLIARTRRREVEKGQIEKEGSSKLRHYMLNWFVNCSCYVFDVFFKVNHSIGELRERERER